MNRVIAALVCACLAAGALSAQEAKPVEPASGIYSIKLRTIDGEDTTLAAYRGKVLLIVNVASRCGFTPQYKGLQELHAQNRDKGLVVLGFPSNDFGRQEPGSEAEIKSFCSTKFGVDFPLFAKIVVKGPEKHPLYKFLTEKETNADFSGEVAWNFTKFLVDRNGKVIARFGSRDKPDGEKMMQAVAEALAK